jgi:hypothetical protein
MSQVQVQQQQQHVLGGHLITVDAQLNQQTVASQPGGVCYAIDLGQLGTMPFLITSAANGSQQQQQQANI